MADIILFHFEQAEVRYVGDGINHAWVAQDVCNALEIKRTSDAIARLDEDEKGTVLIDTPGGEQRMLTVNEPGLYSLVLGSRKPVSKRFKRWVVHEVIPSIRKTGSYSLEQEKTKLEKQFLPIPTAKSLKEFHGLHKLMYGKPYADRWLAAKIKEYYPEHVGIAPAPEELPSLPPKALFTPRDIAVEVGVFCKSNPESGDARWVNQKLAELCYQEKIAGQWSATAKAEGLCDRKPVDTNSRTQKDQLKWSADVIAILKEHVTSPQG